MQTHGTSSVRRVKINIQTFESRADSQEQVLISMHACMLHVHACHMYSHRQYTGCRSLEYKCNLTLQTVAPQASTHALPRLHVVSHTHLLVFRMYCNPIHCQPVCKITYITERACHEQINDYQWMDDFYQPSSSQTLQDLHNIQKFDTRNHTHHFSDRALRLHSHAHYHVSTRVYMYMQ